MWRCLPLLIAAAMVLALVAADASGIAGQCGGFVKVESKYVSTLPRGGLVGVVALRGTQRGLRVCSDDPCLGVTHLCIPCACMIRGSFDLISLVLCDVCGHRFAANQQIDYSRIKVHLVSLSGFNKGSTDCAPNGYFFLPVYDKGSYVLKIQGPEGWTFGACRPFTFPSLSAVGSMPRSRWA